MSLVAYGSSDESDSEERSTSAAAENRPSGGGLFSLLPLPKQKTARSTEGNRGSSKEKQYKPSGENNSSSNDLIPQTARGGLFSSLPKPRKRTEPVKITVPLVQRRDVSMESVHTFDHVCQTL